MNRYTASKRRKEAKARNHEAVGNTKCNAVQPNDLEPVEYQPNKTCSGTQTDLTASHLLSVEDDYKK